MKTVTDKCVSIIKGRAEEREIDLIYKFPDDICTEVLGDEVIIERILMNVLDNAVKYTENNGSVEFIVDAEFLEENKVKFSYIIKDSGIGMSEEFLEKIWDKCSREDREESRGILGNGFGMSMVKKYVDILGGTIDVNSKIGVGSKFKVEIVFEKANETKGHKSLSDLHVLLADDNDINREIFAELLCDSGMTVFEAQNGEQACEMFEQNKISFDAIIMDMRMPVKDVFTATKWIRNSNYANAKTIPIIAMTANTSKEQIEKAFTCGVNAHVSKPINIDELIEIIKRLCC